MSGSSFVYYSQCLNFQCKVIANFVRRSKKRQGNFKFLFSCQETGSTLLKKEFLYHACITISIIIYCGIASVAIRSYSLIDNCVNFQLYIFK